MKVIESKDYEVLCGEFQLKWISLLKETLKTHGIDKEKAKTICEDFSFDFSMYLDQGEVELGKKYFVPTIGFFYADTDDLRLADKPIAFHEYSFGTVEEAFETPY